jgi:hypothetical protein
MSADKVAEKLGKDTLMAQTMLGLITPFSPP